MHASTTATRMSAFSPPLACYSSFLNDSWIYICLLFFLSLGSLLPLCFNCMFACDESVHNEPTKCSSRLNVSDFRTTCKANFYCDYKLLFCVRFKFHARFQSCMTFKSLPFVRRGHPLISQVWFFWPLCKMLLFISAFQHFIALSLVLNFTKHSLYPVLYKSKMGQWVYGKRFWVQRIPRVEVSWVP